LTSPNSKEHNKVPTYSVSPLSSRRGETERAGEPFRDRQTLYVGEMLVAAKERTSLEMDNKNEQLCNCVLPPESYAPVRCWQQIEDRALTMSKLAVRQTTGDRTDRLFRSAKRKGFLLDCAPLSAPTCEYFCLASFARMVCQLPFTTASSCFTAPFLGTRRDSHMQIYARCKTSSFCSALLPQSEASDLLFAASLLPSAFLLFSCPHSWTGHGRGDSTSSTSHIFENVVIPPYFSRQVLDDVQGFHLESLTFFHICVKSPYGVPRQSECLPCVHVHAVLCALCSVLCALCSSSFTLFRVYHHLLLSSLVALFIPKRDIIFVLTLFRMPCIKSHVFQNKLRLRSCSKRVSKKNKNKK